MRTRCSFSGDRPCGLTERHHLPSFRDRSAARYSLDGTTWTDSNTFASGIEPNKQYTVYARYKETQTALASASSSSQITTPKAPGQNAPAAPVLTATYNSITVEAIDGCEYSLDDASWADSNTFASGIEPNKQYAVYARYKETQTALASASSSSQITTPKAPQNIPAAPVLSATYNSITVEAVAGCEYSLDNATWTDSNTFTSGIEIKKQYTVYARYKATQTTQASASSSSQITTPDVPQPAGIKLSAGTVTQNTTGTMTNYIVNLRDTDASETITLASAYPNAKMTIDGKPVVSETINLAGGKSITMTVKVTWNNQTTTYKLTINRPKSGNNLLSKLTATTGRLSPKFNPAVRNYTVKLPKGVYSCTINWKVKDSHSKVIINEKPRSNWRFGLHYGQIETINLIVYAQDGSSTVYTITAIAPGA